MAIQVRGQAFRNNLALRYNLYPFGNKLLDFIIKQRVMRASKDYGINPAGFFKQISDILEYCLERFNK